jgi:arsenate reductase-like glutaredoxin family protein
MIFTEDEFKAMFDIMYNCQNIKTARKLFDLLYSSKVIRNIDEKPIKGSELLTGYNKTGKELKIENK